MAFIISKKSTNHGEEQIFYYLVENYRKEGKIKRRGILNLGLCPTLEWFDRKLNIQEADYTEILRNRKIELKELIEEGKFPMRLAQLNERAMYMTKEQILKKLTDSIKKTLARLEKIQEDRKILKKYL